MTEEYISSMKINSVLKQDKLYYCDLCAASFTFLHGLDCHIHMHTMGTPVLDQGETSITMLLDSCDNVLLDARTMNSCPRRLNAQKAIRCYSKQDQGNTDTDVLSIPTKTKTILKQKLLKTKTQTPTESDVSGKIQEVQENPDTTALQSTVGKFSVSVSLKPSGLESRSLSRKQYACDVCNTKFGRYMDYYEHIRLHYFEPPYSSISGASLTEADYGPQHSSYDTGNNKKLFKREVDDEEDDCGIMELNHESFLTEQSGLHSSLPLEWEVPKDMKPKRKRREKLMTCEICGVNIKGSSQFRIHARTHTGEKPYKCEDCGSSFSTRATLRGHMLTHTGERPYICLVCGSMFTQPGALKKHTMIHTGERPFQCDICYSRFTQRSHLTNHISIYNGLCIQPGLLRRKRDRGEIILKNVSSPESRGTRRQNIHMDKKFTCLTCGAKFVQQGSLGRHKRTHTGDKPHVCDNCGVGFTQKCHLINHSKNYNGCSRIRF